MTPCMASSLLAMQAPPLPPQEVVGGWLKDLNQEFQAEKTLPSLIKEKETHWLRRAVSPLHHKATKRRSSLPHYNDNNGDLEGYWKGKGYIAVPAYKGSLAEAKKEMPATKPELSLKLKRTA
eukprot:399568-Pelagomonas_calceolata.AAC.3